jgi:hypothetical protein
MEAGESTLVLSDSFDDNSMEYKLIELKEEVLEQLLADKDGAIQ